MMEAMRAGTGRITKLDVGITAAVAVLGLVLMVANVTDPEIEASVVSVPLFLIVTLPMLWRRAAPLAAAAAVTVLLLVHLVLFGTEVIRCGVILPMCFLLAFSSGKYLDKRLALAGLGLCSIPILIEGAYFIGVPFSLVVVGVTAVIWATGRLVRSRTRMAEELEVRTGELQAARDERARLEVATDRARLSGELDELLQRRLAELAQLAERGSQSADPAATAATLADIERESRRTLEEMREVVGVLRDDGYGAPTDPQPTLTHLEALLVRAKGSDARLNVEGNPRVLPAGVELSAYRVVEQLLAALDDAPDVEVTVRFGEDALELAVSGPARRRAGAAIERARQRVELHHGTLEATTRRGHAEALVSLPVLARA